jgi:hypothetical protein
MARPPTETRSHRNACPMRNHQRDWFVALDVGCVAGEFECSRAERFAGLA